MPSSGDGGSILSASRVVRAETTRYQYFDRLAREEKDVAGLAWLSYGKMSVGHGVPELVERALRSPTPTLSPEHLDRLRQALATLLHESIHFAVRRSFNANRHDVQLRGVSGRFLEEGVTEAATQDLLPQVLQGAEAMARA